MKRGTKLSDALVSVETAWICAAEMDVQREEEEGQETMNKLRRQRVKDKYELAGDALRLDQELKEQQLQWKNKMEQRRMRQQSTEVRETAQTNNKKKPSVYAMENLRLAMLMKDTSLLQRLKRKKVRPRIVQDMLTLERRYAEAARRLQKWWRDYMHRQFWKLCFQQMKAIVQIQRIARGYLTRRWVYIWHVNRTIRITKLQALFRGYYIRWRVLPTWKRWEFLNAARIQSVVRMYFAKKFCYRYQRGVAALCIQTVWRGFSSRKRSDILWLEQKVINLQRLIRGSLARKHARKRGVRLNRCAVEIQRMFRGMKTRMEIELLLRDRETRHRQDYMLILEAEEEWHRVQRDKLQARLNRKQLRERVMQLEYEYYVRHEKIHDMESIYLDMQTQRMRVSPRAIEHGWVEEMEEKMKAQRVLITKMKMDTVFGVGLEFKTKEMELIRFQHQIDQLEEKRRRFEIWRNEEFLDYWECDCQSRYEEKKAQRLLKIAETRRRWQVNLFRTNGKRDNRWRGSSWTPEVIEAAEGKEVFCIGSTDILAAIQDKWHQRMENAMSKNTAMDNAGMEHNTRAHIDHITDQVALTTAAVQIEQTKTLFDPVFQEVERSFDEVQRWQGGHERRLKATKNNQRMRQLEQDDPGPNMSNIVEVALSNDPTRRSNHLQQKRQQTLAAKVPWHLIDQLAVERHNLAQEKAMFKLWGKAYPTEGN